MSLWRGEGSRVIEEATTTAALLVAAAQGRTDTSLVSEAVRRVGASLDRLAADAPSDTARAAATGVAARLREVLFDVESDALLRGATPDAGAAAPAAAAAAAEDPELVDAIARLREEFEQVAEPSS